jgi:tetrahydromethanopterin S-methyltransferase subunit B
MMAETSRAVEQDLMLVRLELATMGSQQKDNIRRIEQIEEKLDARYTTTQEHQSLSKRVESMEGNQKWVVRTILGVVISALLALILTAKKGGFL